MTQIFNNPSDAFQVSVTELYVRILVHPGHRCLPGFQRGCSIKFHKQADIPHFQVYGALAKRRRNPTEPEQQQLELTNQTVKPQETAEGLVEIVFNRRLHPELRSLTPFHHTICDIPAQNGGTQMWLFPLPRHRRVR